MGSAIGMLDEVVADDPPIAAAPVPVNVVELPGWLAPEATPSFLRAEFEIVSALEVPAVSVAVFLD